MPSYRDVRKRLREDGWTIERQTGSHEIWKHLVKPGTVVVAGHHGGDEIPKGTYHDIMKKAGLK